MKTFEKKIIVPVDVDTWKRLKQQQEAGFSMAFLVRQGIAIVLKQKEATTNGV
jgi:hypothetical protein